MTTTTISAPARLSPRDWIEKITNNFLLRRIVKAFFTIWVVTTITFFVIRAMPSNPV